MNIQFTGKIWYWKGPAPWYFVTVPAEPSGDLKDISSFVTYGWGMIPVPPPFMSNTASDSANQIP